MDGQLAPLTPDPATKRSFPRPQPLPQGINQLPPLSVVMTPAYNRRYRPWWPFFWCLGFTLTTYGFLNIPGLPVPIATEIFLPYIIVVMFPPIFVIHYFSRVSHHMPSKPVGRYAKHGSELVSLMYAVMVVQCFDTDLEHMMYGLACVTGVNICSHTLYQLLRNPPDLDWWDFSLVEVMQVAVYASSVNLYAVVATIVVCLMVIGYRFYFYSCPETCDAPVEIVQKFGSEKAC